MISSIRINSTSKAILSLAVFAALLFFAGMSACSNRNKELHEAKNVVFIGSFHDNHVWTANVRNAMVEEFGRQHYPINLSNIYLNSKNISSLEERRNILQSHLTPVLDKTDAIIVSDLEAAYQVLDYQRQIPQQIPVILLSVFDDPDSIHSPNIFLLNSEIGFRQTVKTAGKLFPAARKIYVWSDKTLTGRFYLEQARKQLKAFEQQYDIEYDVDAATDEDLYQHSCQLRANSFLLLCTWQQGDNGRYYDPQILYPKIASNTHTPVFSVVGNVLQGGFVGGYVLSPFRNGRAAADKAIRIWEDGIAQSPRIEVIPPKPVFNHSAMKYWHARSGALPDDAQILFDWKDYVRNNIYWIGNVLIVIFVFLLVIAIMFFYRRILVHKNKALRQSNEDYKKLLDTFNAQYHELTELKDNQEAALDIEGVSVWTYDLKTHRYQTLRKNQQPAEIRSTEDILQYMHPDDRQKYIEFEQLIDQVDPSKFTGEKRISGQTRYIHPDGSYHYYENQTIVKFAQGRVVKVTGTQKDVTKQVVYQQQLEKAQQEATLSTQILNEIFDRVPGGLYIKEVSENFIYLKANQAFCEIAGKTPEKVIGKTDYEVFDHDAADVYHSFDIELKNGRKLVVSYSATPIIKGRKEF